MDETEVLERYRKAFMAANGKEPPSIIYTGHGWYAVDGRDKRRLKDFLVWAGRLEARAAPPQQ